jgi:RHS repeat-associated protein
LIRAGQNYYIYGPGGLVISRITTGVASYHHHDQLGSTRVLTNSSGEVIGTYRYGPNGAIWKQTGTGTSIGFAGQFRLNTQKQLIYLRARVYDPATAQFLSPDPLAAVSGETYAYAAANPVNFTDPLGLLTDACSCPRPPCPPKHQSGTPTGFPERFPADNTGTNVPKYEYPTIGPARTDIKGQCLVGGIAAGGGVHVQICGLYGGGQVGIRAGAGYGVDVGAHIYGGRGKFQTNAHSFSDLQGKSDYFTFSGGTGAGVGSIVVTGDSGVTSTIVWTGRRVGTPVSVGGGRFQEATDTIPISGR